MTFSFGKRDHDKDVKTVLFVCVQNAGRSQMSEGFFRKYAPKGYEPISAGTVPTSQINQIAVEVMEEVGIDVSKQKPKDLTEDMMGNATAIINMGCMDDKFCPALYVPKVIDWGIEDPQDRPIEKVREIRDEIERRVLEVIESARNNKIPI
ncbi:arsenate reductase ArsC [Candidatus Nitrosocosmicus agrestis]|jgi:protein-tyrosine-phosphatase|uniref:arsenate reductase ArsC n=1 Tax=Candidatus Nitrosocosmicus agrestis TaxID=2563600 RepID=UPI00122DF2BF|nr:arsenate reductase ArsC [Candidatus Nitrosocosmicus sp. SS]KAA2282949.1 arsenate reductase ArsC [Candidatus Nitrosocosmicus sp. SS]KAF0869152.1 arsenate reductase ArsC [Candidatus Nitrosocosmicus sp. SS]